MRRLLARFLVQRYRDPMLHPGVFTMSPGPKAVVWEAVIAPEAVVDTSPGHRHQVKVCTITAGMAHVDQCWCGSTRYGVFGAWS